MSDEHLSELGESFVVPAADWEICRDCLDPLAEYLEKARMRWLDDQHGFQELSKDIERLQIWWDFVGEPIFARDAPQLPDIGFAAVWLSVNVSAGLAAQFESELNRVINDVGTETKLLVKFWGEYDAWAPQRVERNEEFDIDVTHIEIRTQDYEFHCEHVREINRSLRRACKYLRQLSVALSSRHLQNRPRKSDVKASIKLEAESKGMPAREQIDRVREIVKEDPFMIFDTIQDKLREKHGHGMNNGALVLALDILREESVYRVPKRRNGNGDDHH